jgi:hypothetical protein
LPAAAPKPGSEIIEGFPDQPDNPLNWHPAGSNSSPPPLLTPETAGKTTYFPFTPLWFEVAAWRYLVNAGRRACICWHRRAGKHELGMAYPARTEPGSYWILYPTIELPRTVLWSMRVGSELRISRMFPEAFRRRTGDSDMTIELLNGSRLQFIGSDNFDALRGASVKGIVFSEYASALPQAWPTLRTMIDPNNEIAIFISTPRGASSPTPESHTRHTPTIRCRSC